MSKIRAEHLERQALIYVRQSTLTQVRENLGSQARQYDLVKRAIDLGWAQPQIVVIDQDQGRSGASIEGRDGFQLLVAEVGMAHAGAVFSLEASRLARSCVDWYRLLEICALTQTLVIDEDVTSRATIHHRFAGMMHQSFAPTVYHSFAATMRHWFAAKQHHKGCAKGLSSRHYR